MNVRSYLRRGYRTMLPLLFGRAHFKALLKSTLGDMDVRVQQLAAVSDYFSSVVRPIRIRAPFGHSMLVVAPHQDDEIIGCGGALALQVRTGERAHIVVLQDGADEHESVGIGRQELAELRNEESRRAAAVLRVEPPQFLNRADLARDRAQTSAMLSDILVKRQVDVVFAPFVLDAHVDHRRANYILCQALRNIRSNIRIFGYEVWGFCIPNVALPIDEVIDLKLLALSRFIYANQTLNYTWSTRGVNMYRSRMLELGVCDYAECFFEIPRQEYIDLVTQIEGIECHEGNRP